MTETTSSLDFGRIAQEMQVRKMQVENVVHLLDEGNTVPFITRYRKERTGGLNEDLIRQIQKRLQQHRQLFERKQTILKSIQAQGKLTEELQRAILAADGSKRLEDLYLPYKPKKKTLASVARERGLEPLALAIWNKDPAVADLSVIWPTMVNPEKELATVEDVQAGVQHVIAEVIAESADVRDAARRVLWDTGRLTATKAENVPDGQGLEFKDYFQFQESIRQIPPHRVLAINRAERHNAIKVRIDHNAELFQNVVLHKLPLADHPHVPFLVRCVVDAIQRLLVPSLEREIRRDLTERSEDHAVQVFARNLRRLLLQPPIVGQRLLALDPGYRTGCKVAVLDEFGNLLEHTVIYPHGGGKREDKRAKNTAPPPPASPTPEGAAPPTSEALPVTTPVPGDNVAALPASDPNSGVAEVAGLPTPPPADLGSLATSATDSAPAPMLQAEVTPQAATEPAPDPTATTGSLATSATDQPTADTSQPTSATGPATAAPSPEAPPAVNRIAEAQRILEELIRKHNVNLVSIGNGSACRETEELVSSLIKEKLPELAYAIVNEAGASYYSASNVGREEFPELDATVRGTISIGRRLQDPLSELVKIDPQNVGVGLYQHDVGEKRLKESLEGVVESCVNYVGVDVNTASVPLLRHVSGLNQLSARSLVEYRKANGPFRNRAAFKDVPGIGEVTFTQAAGFLRIRGGENPLDDTWVHPESYPATEKLLGLIGCGPDVFGDGAKLADLATKLRAASADEMARQLNVGIPTFCDIADALSRPGRDPREELPQPVFKKGVLQFEDLQLGMELKGTVLNVVDFGAFVDVGLKDSGLVHISQLANRYVRSPHDVVAVGDVVTVWVYSVDNERRRVSLTMIPPGVERRPFERRGEGGRQQQQQPRERPPQRRGERQGDGQQRRGRRPAPHRRAPEPARAPADVPVPQEAAVATAEAPELTTTQPPNNLTAEPPNTPTTQPPPTQPPCDRRPPPPRRQQQHQHQRQQHQRQQQYRQPVRQNRPPRREAPQANLTDEALQGDEPLRTFGELKAFFEAKKKE